jgi:phosphoglycerate dehydrogenase-like enzyme
MTSQRQDSRRTGSGQVARIVVTADFDPFALERLRTLGRVTYAGWGYERRILSGPEWHDLLSGADIALIEVEQIGEDELARAPDLRLIGVARGTPVVADIPAITRHGICMFTTPGRNAESVADLTMAFAIMLARNVGPAMRHVSDGRWANGTVRTYLGFRGRELEGLTLGVVGFGAVGRLVARHASEFGMRILVCDPFASEPLHIDRTELVTLAELLGRSDIVTLHAAVTPETRRMIGQAEFALMKRGVMFINTARAALVDGEALLGALRVGHVASAALDVFDREPLPSDSPLLAFPNVVMTPHIGGATEDVVVRHSAMLVEGVEAWLAGKVPSACVNPEVIDRKPPVVAPAERS